MRRHSSTSVRACVLGLVIVACQVFLPETSWGQKKPKESAGQKHVFSGPAPAHPFDIVLARPTANSITASVMVARESHGYIAYGVEKGQLASKSQIMKLPAGTPVEFLLKDLVPDTGYYYRLHYRESVAPDYVTSGEFSFHTQRKSGSPFVFTIQADSHLDQGTRPAVYERTLANALADGTDFHVDLGDTFMTDKYPNYADSLPQYIAQRYYLGLAGCSAPVFLVAGNHDGERLDRYNGTPNCMPVWAALTRRKYFPPPVPNSFYTGSTAEVKYAGRPENYFAFEWGDAQLIALDPFWTTARKGKGANEGNWSRTLGQAQYQWLAKTLAASKARYKFVFIHHLVGGLDESARGGSEAAVLYEWGGKGKDGTDEFKARRPGWAMPIHQLLVKHKVAAVFHGHDHFFARQELDDIAYVMVPQPGHAGFDRLRNVDEYGYIRGDFLPPSGHVRVSVSADRATVAYVRAYLPQVETAQRKNGEVSYTFNIRR